MSPQRLLTFSFLPEVSNGTVALSDLLDQSVGGLWLFFYLLLKHKAQKAVYKPTGGRSHTHTNKATFGGILACLGLAELGSNRPQLVSVSGRFSSLLTIGLSFWLSLAVAFTLAAAA